MICRFAVIKAPRKWLVVGFKYERRKKLLMIKPTWQITATLQLNSNLTSVEKQEVARSKRKQAGRAIARN